MYGYFNHIKKGVKDHIVALWPLLKEMTKRNLFACGLAKAYWVYSIPVRANPVKLMLLVLKAVSAAM